MGAEAGSYDARRVMSEPDFEDVRKAQTSFSALSSALTVSPAVSTESMTEIQPGEAVDGPYFSLLGVTPAIGRLIQETDDSAAAEVVVLSHALWRSRFNADPAVVGRTVRLSGRPFEIIGVAPESFGGPIPGPMGTRLWIPRSQGLSLSLLNPTSTTPDRERRRLTVFGRLRAGHTIQQASSELAALATSMDATYPRRPRHNRASRHAAAGVPRLWRR